MNTRVGNDQRGMVLVIVLWIVTLLAVMAGGFAYSMRVETRLATSAVEWAQARALAEALPQGITHIVASPLRRALQTAQAVAAARGLPVTTSEVGT